MRPVTYAEERGKGVGRKGGEARADDIRGAPHVSSQTLNPDFSDYWKGSVNCY